MKSIACIPADNVGNLLFILYEESNGRFFIKYKSTYNDIPFTETEMYLVDNNTNFIITGNNGIPLFRFSVNRINTLIN